MAESPSAHDSEIESTLMKLVLQRGLHASACPSEVARALSPDHWRGLMPQIRAVASRLAQQGKIEIAQGVKAVSNIGPWVGPIRLRVPRKN